MSSDVDEPSVFCGRIDVSILYFYLHLAFVADYY